MPTELRPRKAPCSQYEHHADLTPTKFWRQIVGELLLTISMFVAIATVATLAGSHDATPSVQAQPDDNSLFYIGYMP